MLLFCFSLTANCNATGAKDIRTTLRAMKRDCCSKWSRTLTATNAGARTCYIQGRRRQKEEAKTVPHTKQAPSNGKLGTR